MIHKMLRPNFVITLMYLCILNVLLNNIYMNFEMEIKIETKLRRPMNKEAHGLGAYFKAYLGRSI